MSKKEKREKDQEKNIPQQETACEEETEKRRKLKLRPGIRRRGRGSPKRPLEELQRSWAGRRTCC